MRRAAIDIGTNSVRLLVGDETGDVLRRTVVTGLGRATSHTGRLNREGWGRTLEVLAAYRQDLRGTERARAVMTSVGRKANDVASFLDEATVVLGFRPDVISGEEEAALSYAGAVADLTGEDWTVVDIGGGSTEIVTAGSASSFDIGSVTLTDLYLRERPVARSGLGEAREATRSVLELSPAAGGVVGVAGTWTSLSGMTMQLDPYRPDLVHHSRLTSDTVEGWVGRLSGMSVEETARLPGLDPARAPVILGGSIVAETVLAALATAECLVSEHDLLDGVLIDLV